MRCVILPETVSQLSVDHTRMCICHLSDAATAGSVSAFASVSMHTFVQAIFSENIAQIFTNFYSTVSAYWFCGSTDLSSKSVCWYSRIINNIEQWACATLEYTLYNTYQWMLITLMAPKEQEDIIQNSSFSLGLNNQTKSTTYQATSCLVTLSNQRYTEYTNSTMAASNRLVF